MSQETDALLSLCAQGSTISFHFPSATTTQKNWGKPNFLYRALMPGKLWEGHNDSLTSCGRAERRRTRVVAARQLRGKDPFGNTLLGQSPLLRVTSAFRDPMRLQCLSSSSSWEPLLRDARG